MDSYFITKCDRTLLQNAAGFLLQNATVITKCDDFITQCGSCYKIRRFLQIVTVQLLYSLIRVAVYVYGNHIDLIYLVSLYLFPCHLIEESKKTVMIFSNLSKPLLQ